MVSYIIRRLLIMIPTLIGMTLMLFMLVAYSPGGIGGSEIFAGGAGQQGATQTALRRAALEDRYGLDDPKIVQYVRWLGRISPVKLGYRDQLTPRGERVQLPPDIKPVPAADWFPGQGITTPERVEATPFEFDEDLPQEERVSAYRRATSDFASARAEYLGARVDIESLIVRYFEDVGLDRFVDKKDNQPTDRGLRRHEPDPSHPLMPEIEAAVADAASKREAVIAAQEALESIVRARIFRGSGIGLGPITIDKPDLGTSLVSKRPVEEEVIEALKVTLLLNLIAIPIIYLIAIPSGMLAAVKQGKALDTGLGAVFIALYSVPVVLAGVLLIGYLANQQYLGDWAFPVKGLSAAEAESFAFLPSVDEAGDFQRGWLLDRVWHMCLPILCLVYGGFAVLSKQTRAAMLENFSADYVRTAKAKGVAPNDVVTRHVFRNSLLPLITMFVSVFPIMLSGSVVIERIFTVPGMGNLVISAINDRDIEVVLATAFIIGLVNVLALLLADILYALADPRISYK